MKTIYVDFDGTIVDVMPRYHGILQSYLKKDKPIELDFNKYKCLKRQGIKDYNIVKSLCEGYELELDDYLKYKRLNLESLEWLKMDKVIGNPKEAYDKLKNQGYKVVLLTKRRHEKNLFKQVNLLNIEKCFDEIVVVKPLLNQNLQFQYLE
jgi:phosphoglycolate phosphatase-like HAD superfamily hydrolase